MKKINKIYEQTIRLMRTKKKKKTAGGFLRLVFRNKSCSVEFIVKNC